jgi:hypothetical protein
MCGAVPPPITPRPVDQQSSSTRHKAAGWAKLGTGLLVLAGEVAEGWLHPALADALAIADVAIPVASMLIVFAAIIFGSDQTCERVFRFLRWVTNRPEPPAPGSTPPTTPGSGPSPAAGSASPSSSNSHASS